MHLIGQPLPKQKRNLRELHDNPRTLSLGRLPCPEGSWKWERSQEVIPEVSSLLPPQGFLDGGGGVGSSGPAAGRQPGILGHP